MKVFGYGEVILEEFGLQAMREVSFEGTPDELRCVARFLIQKAEELEMRTFRISHMHMPRKGLEEGSCDVIVLFWPEEEYEEPPRIKTSKEPPS
ncbi:MAG: hypothetical protein H6718_13770 [Polyangiaceae bacterium]|nr:hypothetical protein [Myxococcales bacterium]MCB9586465.1 hypothetical protein [Polyangiaceae bacterium]